MIGDVFIVVVDEIGEVTFARDPMIPHVVEMYKKETVTRCFAAIIELVDVCSTLVPVSAAQFELQKAFELLLRDQDFLTERLFEEVEFSDSVEEAAGLVGLLEGNKFRRRRK
jgi:hypothetical protein